VLNESTNAACLKLTNGEFTVIANNEDEARTIVENKCHLTLGRDIVCDEPINKINWCFPIRFKKHIINIKKD